MTDTAISFESLLKVRKGAVEFVEVPEFGFAVVAGTGAPGGAKFTQALQALYAVSYGGALPGEETAWPGAEGHAAGSAVVGR
jgi:hypothetical protein